MPPIRRIVFLLSRVASFFDMIICVEICVCSDMGWCVLLCELHIEIVSGNERTKGHDRTRVEYIPRSAGVQFMSILTLVDLYLVFSYDCCSLMNMSM